MTDFTEEQKQTAMTGGLCLFAVIVSLIVMPFLYAVN